MSNYPERLVNKRIKIMKKKHYGKPPIDSLDRLVVISIE